LFSERRINPERLCILIIGCSLNRIRMVKLIFQLIIFCFFFLGGTGVVAKIRLPQLISDKMVLQRDITLDIWGWADVGEKVTVRFQGKHYYTEAGPDGKWAVQLPPQAAGGPYIMEVNEI